MDINRYRHRGTAVNRFAFVLEKISVWVCAGVLITPPSWGGTRNGLPPQPLPHGGVQTDYPPRPLPMGGY